MAKRKDGNSKFNVYLEPDMRPDSYIDSVYTYLLKDAETLGLALYPEAHKVYVIRARYDPHAQASYNLRMHLKTPEAAEKRKQRMRDFLDGKTGSRST